MRVLYFSGERSYMDYLTSTGVLRSSQVDGSYDGPPDRLVAFRGAVAVLGFATSEPWKWANEGPAWGKPLEYQLVSDAGYPSYRILLAVRTGDLGDLRPCLARLVPMFHRATVDFMVNPSPTTRTILSIIGKTRQAYTDSQARSEHAVAVMRDDGWVSNGKDRTVGEFDLSPAGRVARPVTITTPAFLAQRKQLKPNLSAADIATNEFINPAIGLPAK